MITAPHFSRGSEPVGQQNLKTDSPLVSVVAALFGRGATLVADAITAGP